MRQHRLTCLLRNDRPSRWKSKMRKDRELAQLLAMVHTLLVFS